MCIQSFYVDSYCVFLEKNDQKNILMNWLTELIEWLMIDKSEWLI